MNVMSCKHWTDHDYDKLGFEPETSSRWFPRGYIFCKKCGRVKQFTFKGIDGIIVKTIK